jgi:hypothetical protein
MILNYRNIKEDSYIKRLDGKFIMDFITVNSDFPSEWIVFCSWYDDFKKRDIPFFITYDPKTTKKKGVEKLLLFKTLWIEELAHPMVHHSKSKDRITFDMSNVEKI